MNQPPRGRARGRARANVPQAAPQPPAAARAPVPVPASSSSSSGSSRPPIGRSAAKPQHTAAGDIATRTAQISLASGSTPGNGGSNNGSGNGNGNGNGGRPVGRGAVRPSRSDAEVLQTRPANLESKNGTVGQQVQLMANYFELRTDKKWELCKHHVDFNPVEDRTFVRKRLMRQHRARFSNYLFDGSTLITFQNACPNGNLELTSVDNEEKVYNITIKFVGVVKTTDYQYLQVRNIIMREAQRHLNLEEIRRKYYDPEAKITIAEHKLELWPGYDTSVMQCERSVMLLAEITYKVLRKDTAYDVFTTCMRDRSQDPVVAFSNAIIGSVIMTTYNRKTYRIDEVDFNQKPTNTFSQTRKGETTNITYIDYFKNKYNENIQDRNQPMLVSRPSARERRAGANEMIYLVPELCTMTGLTDAMRSNFQLMKAVASHTCVAPGDRIRRLNNFNQRLNSIQETTAHIRSWGMELARNLVEINGRILPTEVIKVAGDRRYDAGRDANWNRNLRSNKMLHSVDLTKWVILFPGRSEREAKEFCMTLIKVAQGMQYTISRPNLVPLQSDRASDYVNGLDKAINEYNPQLVMCVLSNNRADRYSAIKKKCIVERAVPSQVMLFKSITSKEVMSIATKVAIQMNCKVGGAPWTVDIPIPLIMTIGYDVCHDPSDKRKSYGAMVASLDKACARWYSTITRHTAGEELSVNFAASVRKSLEKFKSVNSGQIPNMIVIFRDGVGEGQLAYVHSQEVDQVKAAVADEYKKANKELKLCFIVVTKRINTRLFCGNQNPPPGTIVDDVITNPHRYDFFLVSQSVRQGTVSPTHYNVIYDTTGMKCDHVQRLTYKMTHLYYNWSGTVRVPAQCQYAHKLAFLTSQSVGTPHTNMDSFLYYL